jgi:cytochrome c-type biogenesis protein CcmF
VILVGELALWVALLMAAWGAIVSFAGARSRRAELIESGERALYATFACVVLATAGLLVALVTSDFSLKYVASVTSANLPLAYKLAALWAGQPGALLFWTLILSTYGATAVARNRTRNRAVMPYVAGTLSAVTLFFVAMMCLAASPYERLALIPPEGRGMLPLLQNPRVMVHPPSLYLGYAATTIPFAFAIGALAASRLDDDWLRSVRRWSLLAWGFLTFGMITGMWWAYVEPGWTGHWAWDPVESLSVLPWVTTTAFLHAATTQRARGTVRSWAVLLAASSFLLAMLGAFITPGGLMSAVHSVERSTIDDWSTGLLVVLVAAVGYLGATRLHVLRAGVGADPRESAEASRPVNNLLLVTLAFSVMWGTLFPMLSVAVRGERVAVGLPFVNAPSVSLALLFLALTAMAPLIAWRRSSAANLKGRVLLPVAAATLAIIVLIALGMGDPYPLVSVGLAAAVVATGVQEIARGVSARRRERDEPLMATVGDLIADNRRRYGGYAIRSGVLVFVIAFAGFPFRLEREVSLASGEDAALVDPYGRPWTLTSQGVSQFEQLNRHVIAVALRAARDRTPVALLRTESRQYIDSRGVPTFEPSTEPGIDYSLRQDAYVILDRVAGDRAELRIAFHPIVAWVWIGGVLIGIGGLLVMWPLAERVPSPPSVDRSDA